jgi:hypothetical protein
MKHVFFFLSVILSVTNVWSQSGLRLNRSPFVELKSSYNYVLEEEDETLLTWLTTDNVTQKIGLNGAASVAAFMEFYPEDILNFKGLGKKPVAIKQVQFHLIADEISSVSACRIVIREGSSINSSAEVYSQNVANFVGEWNYVDLSTNYTIDASQNLYIGYEITQTEAAYPMSLISGNEPKQGWIFYDGTGENIPGYMFGIKAIALTEASPLNAITFQSLSIPDYKLVGENLAIEGTVKNIGTENLTSFTLAYNANSVASNVHTFTGLDIAPNATYNFSHPDSLAITEAIMYSISVTTANPNGDTNSSATKSVNTQGVTDIVTRVLLHESFTSSTCGPCKAGNANLKTVLNSVDESRWANIRYQMDWPSTGDPYYTAEGGVKRDLYGINSVPFLVVDGKWGGNSGSYTKAIFNQLAAIPSIVMMSATAETVEKTVNTTITFTPVTTIKDEDIQNFRLFAAVVEKNTTKNKKTNGETEFLYVMKKFLTDVNGDPIESFTSDVPQTVDLSYTFNGNYRLPSNANSPINHTTEHSVENFGNLMVVYWIQNMQSGVVLQAGKTDATFKTGIDQIAQSNATAYIYDNFLHVRSDAPVQNINIYNISGQKVLSTITIDNVVPVEKLPHGIYVVKVKTIQGEIIARVIK